MNTAAASPAGTGTPRAHAGYRARRAANARPARPLGAAARGAAAAVAAANRAAAAAANSHEAAFARDRALFLGGIGDGAAPGDGPQGVRHRAAHGAPDAPGKRSSLSPAARRARRREGTARFGRRALAAFMAVVLAVGLMPLPAFGDDGSVRGVSFNGNLVAGSISTTTTVDADGNETTETTRTKVDDGGNVVSETETESSGGAGLDPDANLRGQYLISQATALKSDGTIQDLAGSDVGKVSEGSDARLSVAAGAEAQKAKEEENALNITFSSNGDGLKEPLAGEAADPLPETTGEQTDVKAIEGTFTVPESEFSAEGYEFVGWAITEEDGTVHILTPDTAVENWEYTTITMPVSKVISYIGEKAGSENASDVDDAMQAAGWIGLQASSWQALTENQVKEEQDETTKAELNDKAEAAKALAEAAKTFAKGDTLTDESPVAKMSEAADKEYVEGKRLADDSATIVPGQASLGGLLELDGREGPTTSDEDLEQLGATKQEVALPEGDLVLSATWSRDAESIGKLFASRGAGQEAGAEALAGLVASAQSTASAAIGDAEQDEGEDASVLEPEQPGDLAQEASPVPSGHRAIVATRQLDDGDEASVLSAGDGIFLLGFAAEEEAADAVARYQGRDEVAFAAIDMPVSAADGEGDGVQTPTELGSLVADLGGIKEGSEKLSTEAGADDGGDVPLVALIDTGAPWHDNVVSRTSVLGTVSGTGGETDVEPAQDWELDDDNGHGTAMLETILAENPDARVASIKALDSTGHGSAAAVYAAIEQAVEAKADIINLSFAGYATTGNSAIAEAVKDAADAGAVVLAAAGNGGTDVAYYTPASANGARAVGAIDDEGRRLDDSNYGDKMFAYVIAQSTSYAAARASGWLSGLGIVDGWEDQLIGGPLCVPTKEAADEAMSDDEIDAKLSQQLSNRRLFVMLGKGGEISEGDRDKVIGSHGDARLLSFENSEETRRAYEAYNSDDSVIFAEPDIPLGINPGDAAAADAPYGDLDSIAAAEGISADDSGGELIALVDTAVAGDGVVASHSVLDGTTGGAVDEAGHGRDMLDAILAESADARVLAVEALDKAGVGSASSAYAAVEYALESGATIVNASFIGEDALGNRIVTQAVQDAAERGVEVIVAAGDSGADARGYSPANQPSAYTVGVCEDDGQIAPDSNRGVAVDAYVLADSSQIAAARVSGWLYSNRTDGWRNKVISSGLMGGTQDSDGVDMAAAGDYFSVDGTGYTTAQTLGYTGAVREITFLRAGRYKFTLTGAGGGAADQLHTTAITNVTTAELNPKGAGGGTTEIVLDIEAGTTLYGVVGQGGKYTQGDDGGYTRYSYNGGARFRRYLTTSGDRPYSGGGGGGCTTLATMTGTRNDLGTANKDKLVAVAGGGGGSVSWKSSNASWCTGTAGGGTQVYGDKYIESRALNADRTGTVIVDNGGSTGNANGVGTDATDLMGGCGGGYFGGKTTGRTQGGRGGTGFVTSSNGTGFTKVSGSTTGGTYLGGSNASSDGFDGSLKIEVVHMSYSVSFGANGGSGTMANQTGFTTGTAKQLSANTYTRTGYAYQGWARTTSATSADYADKASLNFTLANYQSYTTEGVLPLYAVWKANTYSIKFRNSNPVTGAATSESYTMEIKDNTWGNTVGNYNAADPTAGVSGQTLTKPDGYHFKAWHFTVKGASTGLESTWSTDYVVAKDALSSTLLNNLVIGGQTGDAQAAYRMKTDKGWRVDGAQAEAVAEWEPDDYTVVAGRARRARGLGRGGAGAGRERVQAGRAGATGRRAPAGRGRR